MYPCHRCGTFARPRPRRRGAGNMHLREPSHVEVRPPVPPFPTRAGGSRRLLRGTGAGRGEPARRVHVGQGPDGTRHRRRRGLLHGGVQVPRRALLPVRAGRRRDDEPGRDTARRGPRRRLLAAGPRRRRRCLRVVERARACQGPERPDRGDGSGNQAGRAYLPVLHQLVLAVGRPRDVALALPGRGPGRAQVSAQARQATEEPGRHQPVPAAYQPGAADDARPCRRRGALGATAVLPGLVPAAGAGPWPARDRDLEPAAYLAADRMTLARAAGEQRTPGAMSSLTGSIGGGQAARGTARIARWAIGVWLVALVILILNSRGQIFFDTKLGVDLDPAGFYARLWHLWNPQEWFGTLQDQYIGYAFPMAPFYLAGELLRVPVWLTERIWLSLLMAVGFAGLVKLAEAVRVGTDRSRIVAGLAFALWPTFTIVIGSTSAGILPGLLAPWAVLPLAKAAQGGSLVRAAARSGGAVHGRRQRHVHARRAGAAGPVRRDSAERPPAGRSRRPVGGRGGRRHGLVDRAAAAPGEVLVQLPALCGAVSDDHGDDVGGRLPARGGKLDGLSEPGAAVAAGRLGDGRLSGRDPGIGAGGSGRPARPGPPGPAVRRLAAPVARHRRAGRPGRVSRAAWRPAAPAGRRVAERRRRPSPQRVQGRAGGRRRAGARRRARAGAQDQAPRPRRRPGAAGHVAPDRRSRHRAGPARARVPAGLRSAAQLRVVPVGAAVLAPGRQVPEAALAARPRARRF